MKDYKIRNYGADVSVTVKLGNNGIIISIKNFPAYKYSGTIFEIGWQRWSGFVCKHSKIPF